MVEKLADPKTYELPTAELRALILKKEAMDKDVAKAEAAWLKAAEALEAAQ